jgi:heme/copper-type cytochrome/quinol oxidase subunit 3
MLTKYISQAMNVLGHDAATSHAFDTFDERKAAVKKVFCATRCLLFGTWFSAYSLLARHDKWKETYPALVLLCPEGLLTRVTSEHERVWFFS